MAYPLSSLFLKRQFQNWLEEEIQYEDEFMPRQQILYIFVKYDLVPFIKKGGYAFSVPEKTIAEVIARELFHCLVLGRKNLKWHSKRPNHTFREEDFHHFHFIFDTECWEEFWDSVPKWNDIEEWNYKMRNLIEHAVWTNLDLANSSQTLVVDEMLGMYDEDEEEDGKEKEKKDPYLVEQTTHNDY